MSETYFALMVGSKNLCCVLAKYPSESRRDFLYSQPLGFLALLLLSDCYTERGNIETTLRAIRVHCRIGYQLWYKVHLCRKCGDYPTLLHVARPKIAVDCRAHPCWHPSRFNANAACYWMIRYFRVI